MRKVKNLLLAFLMLTSIGQFYAQQKTIATSSRLNVINSNASKGVVSKACNAGTSQVVLASTVSSNNTTAINTELFFEDFGTSDLGVNKGRKSSAYMPASSFLFGNSIANLPPAVADGDCSGTNLSYSQARIDDGYYAIVAPGYIDKGWYLTSNGSTYNDCWATNTSPSGYWHSWWTPPYDKPNTVTDMSGTTTGAAMVINAGNNLNAFYNRSAIVQVGAQYRASLALYVVPGKLPTRIAIDVKDASTQAVIATFTSPLYSTSEQSKWIPVSLDFTMPGTGGQNSCVSKSVIVSFRNDNAGLNGNDYYVDNIKLEKTVDAPACPPERGCVDNGITTVNLNSSFTGTVPSGTQLVWFTTANRSASTQVSNPTSVTVSGTYYAFFYDATNSCYNTTNSTSSVNVTIYPQCPTVPSNFCVTGDCNPNTYMSAVDPNTIEYDNMVSVFHSTIVREYDGNIKVWGQGIAQGGSSQAGNVAPPQLLNAANYGSGTNQLSGKVLKFAAGSNTNSQQFAVLTENGLYFWGNQGTMVPLNNGTNNVNTGAFRKAKVGTYNVSSGNTKADGLPNGVNPADVKMMFGTRDGLAIVTCSGQAWVLSSDGNTYGDGVSDSDANDILWHRVSTAPNIPLANVVAVRGTYRAMMALTASGDLYTWGSGTRLGGSGSGQTEANRNVATLMVKPTGITPKMIGMTRSSSGKSYYVLATNGKLYSMGENGARQLGNGGTGNSDTWVEVTATNNISGTTYSLGGNITWISPQEHDGGNNYAAINVLTNDGKLWAWGSSDGGMLGTSSGSINPTYMPGRTTGAYDEGKLNLTDKLIAVETGGHTTLVIKQCTTKFGYIGHKIRGSMANNTTDSGNETGFNFSDTAELSICGAVSAPVVNNLKVCAGTTANLANATSATLPAGAIGINWWIDAAGTIPVANPLSVGPGTYYATYEGLTVKCPTKMTVSYYTSTDPGYNTCACFNNPATGGTNHDTKVGITLLKRAGAQNADNWPMVRKSGHIALESNTQGFVVTRMTTAQLDAMKTAGTALEGMMSYDTTVNCMKIYTAGDWTCFNTPSCP